MCSCTIRASGGRGSGAASATSGLARSARPAASTRRAGRYSRCQWRRPTTMTERDADAAKVAIHYDRALKLLERARREVEQAEKALVRFYGREEGHRLYRLHMKSLHTAQRQLTKVWEMADNEGDPEMKERCAP